MTDTLVEATFAPVSLTSATGRPSGLVSWGENPAEHFTLGYDRYGRPSLEVAANDQRRTMVADTPLEPGRWARLGALAAGGELRLYVDGTCVATTAWSGALPDSQGWLVGRRADSPAGQDESASGRIRDARVITGAGTPDAVRQLESAGAPDLAPIDIVAALYESRRPDPNRPEYHFMPPAHWMNEPHGPIQVGDIHHLFYQANRRGPSWGAIEWGHATSHDLVHWTHHPPALGPDRVPVAPDGVWSGSSVLDDNGQTLLFFTAGNSSRTPDQAVAVAHFDGTGWEADDELTVEMPPSVNELGLLPGQFRDPFVWREGGAWFMLVGAGVLGRGGTALLFTSDDGSAWKQCSPLLIGDRTTYPGTGEMWELPVLLPVGDKHVFLVCPWWQEVPADQIVEVVHWIGTWDPATAVFVPDHPEPRRFDYGRHFTGPSGNVLADGRTILWSIAQDGRSPDAQRHGAWAHNAGLPLELGLTPNGRLSVQPIRELETLRSACVAEGAVPTVAGMTLELELHATVPPDDEPLSVQITDETGAPHVSLTVDTGRRRIVVHRPGAASFDVWRPATTDEGPLELDGPDVRLRLFLDHSMVEAYLNETYSVTTRIDVSSGPPLISPRVGRRTEVTSCRIWRLDPN